MDICTLFPLPTFHTRIDPVPLCSEAGTGDLLLPDRLLTFN
jgi:hypothetical protein